MSRDLIGTEIRKRTEKLKRGADVNERREVEMKGEPGIPEDSDWESETCSHIQPSITISS